MVESVKCPSGCIAGMRPLMSSRETVNRWQCGNVDCLREFETLKPGYGAVPRPAAEKQHRSEVSMADLKCDLCPTLEFKSPQAIGAHRRYKHGQGPAKTKAKKTSKPRKAAAPRKVAQAPAATKGSAFEFALAPLRARREEILAGIPELREIDSVIAVIEKAQDEGGG